MVLTPPVFGSLPARDRHKCLRRNLPGNPQTFPSLSFCHSNMDGWQFFYDANRNQVICIDDYGYNIIKDLLKNGYCYAEYKENDENYQDYEWN
jgi:hypothetical protein